MRLLNEGGVPEGYQIRRRTFVSIIPETSGPDNEGKAGERASTTDHRSDHGTTDRHKPAVFI